MTKFQNADDDGYDAVLGEVRRWTKEVRTLAGKDLRCLRMLSSLHGLTKKIPAEPSNAYREPAQRRVKTKNTSGLPRRFDIGDQVYYRRDFNNRGIPTYKRLWINQMKCNEYPKSWWYEVQDDQKPKGRSIGWYNEKDLERLMR